MDDSEIPEWMRRIDDFNERWPEAPYGPAHIVLDDYNVLDGHVWFCLDRLERYDPADYPSEHTQEERKATKELLEWLLRVPEEERDQWAG
jgi:hypothetical protein